MTGDIISTGPKTPKIVITCQHNKHSGYEVGDIRGTEVSNMLGGALGEAIMKVAGVNKMRASDKTKEGEKPSFVKVLYASKDETLETCTLGRFTTSGWAEEDKNHACREGGMTIKDRLARMTADESADEVCWIIDLHTFVADPAAVEKRWWVDYADTAVFMHPVAITHKDDDVEHILYNVPHLTEEQKEVNVWMDMEQHNCIMDPHSEKIKCVLMDFAVTERKDEQADKWLASNIDSIAAVLSAAFVKEPAFLSFKEYHQSQ